MEEKYFGLGINDGKYPTNRHHKPLKEYALWYGMLGRCYDEKVRDNYKTYEGCTVSDLFLNYTYFYEWCNSQIGFNCVDYQLDKDIILKGNKIYTDSYCAFVPKRINVLFTKSNNARGEYPIGVSYSKLHNKYKAQCRNIDNKVIHLGLFYDTNAAFYAYKIFKENVIKEVACKYIDHIDIKVYNALMEYTVNITD